MTKTRKIIVTGAAGFLGGEVCAQLSVQNISVLAMVRNSECTANIAQQTCADLSRDDVESVLKAFQPDAIIHCAGKIREPKTATEKQVLMQDNFTATSRLLDAAANLETKPVVVLVSTAAIYAPMNLAQKTIYENHPMLPSGHYGLSKAAATMLANIHISRKTLPIRIAVPFNVIGKGQAPTMVPLAFINQLTENPDAITTGDLRAVRDFIDVRDVAAALIALTGDVPDGAYNIGRGEGVSLGDLLKMVCENQHISPAVNENKSSGEILISVANIDKIRSKTGWFPRYSLETTLRDMMDKYP